MCPRLPTKAAFKIFAAEPSNLQRLQNNVLDVQWKLLSLQSRCKTRQLKNFLHWEAVTLIVCHSRDPRVCFISNILINSVSLTFQGAKSVLRLDSVNHPKHFNVRAYVFKRFVLIPVRGADLRNQTKLQLFQPYSSVLCRASVGSDRLPLNRIFGFALIFCCLLLE